MKEFFWTADEDLARHEAAFRDTAADAGVRSPLNILTRAGTYLSTLPAELGGSQVRLYSWVPGEPIHEDGPGVAAEVGDLLGRLHAVRAPATEAADPWYEVVRTEEQWRSLAQSAGDAAVAWAGELKRALPAIARLSELVTPTAAADLTICHLDIQASNLLRDPDGLILLDWDNVGPGSAERELASTLWRWTRRQGLADASSVVEMLSAYRAAGGYSSVASLAAFGMVAAVHLNFIFVQAELALDPGATADHRERAHAWAADGLATLPTSAAFDELFEVIHAWG